MTIITITANKGGSGKSTTAATIAFALAADDPTLLIDLDPQGHAGIFLGVEPSSNLFDWLVSERFAQGLVSPRQAMPNLHLIPSDTRTKTVDLVYRAEVNGLRHLTNALRQVAEQYRWLVIDTASAGLLQEAALAAADIVVVPFRPEFVGVDGVYGALALTERINLNAHIIVVPVAFNKRLLGQRANVEEIAALASDTITVVPPIPARSAIDKAQTAGLTVWEYPDRSLAGVRAGYQCLMDTIRRVGATHVHGQ